jgi:hypothetical protein
LRRRAQSTEEAKVELASFEQVITARLLEAKTVMAGIASGAARPR